MGTAEPKRQAGSAVRPDGSSWEEGPDPAQEQHGPEPAWDEAGGESQEVRRVLAAREPTERQKLIHLQQNHATYADWCEICVKSKGTGAQHRRQKAELIAQE